MTDFSGLSNLGGSTYTIKVDTSQFDEGMKRAEGTAKTFNKSINTQVVHGSNNAARAFLQLGYAVDDLQYGFNGIVNNIPQIALGLGMGAGVAGAVSILAVAANLAVTHFEDLAGLFERGTTGMEAARMKELADETERAAKEAEKLRNARPETEVRAARGTEKAIGEGPGIDVLNAIREALSRRQSRMASTFEGGEGSIRSTMLGRAWEGIKGAMGFGGNNDISQDIKEEAADLFGRIATDIQARNVAISLAEEFPDLFPKDFATKLGDTSPAMEEFNEKVKKGIKAGEAERKATEELAKAKRDSLDAIKKDIRHRLDMREAELEGQKGILEHQREAIQERISNRPHFGTFSSTQEMMASLQSGILNQVPKAQLEQLKGIKAGIDKLNEQIKGVRGARFQ